MKSSLPTLLLAVATAMLLQACTTGPKISAQTSAVRSQVQGSIETKTVTAIIDSGVKVSAPLPAAAIQERAQSQLSVVRWANRPFVGTRAMAANGDEKLPRAFFEPVQLRFSDVSQNGRVPVDVFFQRVSAATKVPVRLKRDVMDTSSMAVPSVAPSPLNIPIQGQQPASSQPNLLQNPGIVPAPMQSAAGVQNQAAAARAVMQPQAFQPPPVTVDVRPLMASGGSPRLIDVINYATDQIGVAYSYIDGAIVIERFITEALELDFGDGISKASMNFSAKGAEGNSSSGASVDVTQNSDLFASAVSAVREVVSKTPGSNVIATDFGRIVVTTTKETMSRTRDLVRQINSRLQTRIEMQIDVYYMSNTDGDETGFNWTGVYRSLSNITGISAASPASLIGNSAGAITLSVLPRCAGTSTIGCSTSEVSSRIGNSSVLVNLLRSAGYTAYVKSYPIEVMNRTWARDLRNETDYFVSEIVPSAGSSTGGGGVGGAKQSKITTGDELTVRAALLDSGRICISMAASFSDLLSLAKETQGTSGFFTQQPRTSTAATQRQFCHDPGEAVIVSGLSRRVATSNQNSLGENAPIEFGGSRAVGYKTENVMLIVRAAQK